MRHLFILLGISMFFVQGLHAQQDPMFSQYMFNTMSVNPAYAGTNDVLTATGIHRSQWVGIDGAPHTQTITAHSPLPLKRLGLGVSLLNDNIGPINYKSAYVDLAYHLPLNRELTLSFGLKGGINHLSGNLTRLFLQETTDQSFTQDIDSKLQPNFGAGFYLHSERFYAGVSAPKLLENDFSKDISLTRLTQKRHYFFIAGAVFDVNSQLKFKPTTQLRYIDGAPLGIDLSANFLLMDRFWTGALVRVNDAVGLVFQYQINDQLRAGYAYDHTLTDLMSYNSGSHEVMISYDFRFNKSKILSPRYF